MRRSDKEISFKTVIRIFSVLACLQVAIKLSRMTMQKAININKSTNETILKKTLNKSILYNITQISASIKLHSINTKQVTNPNVSLVQISHLIPCDSVLQALS